MGHRRPPCHPTREGKLYCCAVIDTSSRRVVGCAIDPSMRADLATNALGMAIESRRRVDGAIIHADHGTQPTSWTVTERARRAGVLPSLGSLGDPWDNAVVEAFWGLLQVEVLNRQHWSTRVELASAIFEWIAGFDSRRRHSALGWTSPVDLENNHQRARTRLRHVPGNRGHITLEPAQPRKTRHQRRNKSDPTARAIGVSLRPGSRRA